MNKQSILTAGKWCGPLGITRTHVLGSVAIGILLMVGVALGWRNFAPQQEWAPGTMPVSEEIEEKFGVRFTFLAITAEGGMVELRYRVIDEDKAANFGHYTETAPMLVSEDTGEIVDVTIMGLHNHRVEPGRTYYILYRNTAGALKSGRPVTIAIGNYELEHVVPW
jgi:hypothetical protein